MHMITIPIWTQENRSVNITLKRSKTINVWMGQNGKVTVNVPAFNGDKHDTFAYTLALNAACQIADYIEAYIPTAARLAIEQMPGFERS